MQQPVEDTQQELERFISVAAHDLKAPLRTVAQHLTLIAGNPANRLDEKSRKSLAFAVEGAERMRAMIDGLAAYTRLATVAPDLQEIALSPLLDDAMQPLATEIKARDAHITRDPLPQLRCDPALITELLRQLLVNALAYGTQAPRIHVSAIQEDTCWRISVSDNGDGIPPGQEEAVFALFHRAHPRAGAGLGLAVCRRIARLHGGELRAGVRREGGACFYITLPVSPAHGGRN